MFSTGRKFSVGSNVGCSARRLGPPQKMIVTIEIKIATEMIDILAQQEI